MSISWDLRDLEFARVNNVSPKTIKLVFQSCTASLIFHATVALVNKYISSIDLITKEQEKKSTKGHKVMNVWRCIYLRLNSWTSKID